MESHERNCRAIAKGLTQKLVSERSIGLRYEDFDETEPVEECGPPLRRQQKPMAYRPPTQTRQQEEQGESWRPPPLNPPMMSQPVFENEELWDIPTDVPEPEANPCSCAASKKLEELRRRFKDVLDSI